MRLNEYVQILRQIEDEEGNIEVMSYSGIEGYLPAVIPVVQTKHGPKRKIVSISGGR